jgi:uncharacterized membrane protein YjjB (DUF3815 family)
MTPDTWPALAEKGIWGGVAALGFAVLFNVPVRALPVVFLLGLAGIMVKLGLVAWGVNVVLASFAGATLVGVASIRAAHSKHAPPLIFAIPAVIPMVPGIFAYRAMLGLIALCGPTGPDALQGLVETAGNAAKAGFILMALAVGVGAPNLITRKQSVKEIAGIRRGS